MDECHHAASNTSMGLLQKINAKYVYGVSATPKRGDCMDKIIYMMLGPLRHRFTALERAQEQGIGHYFVPRYTRVVDTADSKDDINKAYSLISTSKVRNEMIISDVKKSIAQNQTPVILTRFKEHAKLLYDKLKNEADHVFLLYGDNSDKENVDIYKDDDYKNAHKAYYLADIQDDLSWYGSVYQNITNKFFVDGKLPEEVANEIIHLYHLA